MPASEFTEWMAFFEIEPFGPMRDNLHSGQIASLIYNTNRRKNAPPKTPGDFIYKDLDSRREEETAEFLAGLRALAKPKQ